MSNEELIAKYVGFVESLMDIPGACRPSLSAALDGFKAIFEDGCSQYNMVPRPVPGDKTATTRPPDVRDESQLPPKVPNGRIENPCNFEQKGTHYYSETPIKGQRTNSQNNGNTQKMPTAQENKEKACKMKEDERIRINAQFSNNPIMLNQKIQELNQKYSKMGCPLDAPVNNPQSSSSSDATSSSSIQPSASSSAQSSSSSTPPKYIDRGGTRYFYNPKDGKYYDTNGRYLQ